MPARLVWQIGDRKDVVHLERLRPDQPELVSIQVNTAEWKLRPGPHQVEVRLETEDLLSFNNRRYATFAVRQKPRVLVLADDPARRGRFVEALDALYYAGDIRPTKDAAGADLGAYQAVYLLGVGGPEAGCGTGSSTMCAAAAASASCRRGTT